MPYFERKPYAEMMAEAAAREAQRAEASEEPAFEDLARGVLAAESAPERAYVGPFRVREVVAPGRRGGLTVAIAADRQGGPLTLDFAEGDLRGPGDAAIPASRMRLSPARMTIPPGEAVDVDISILVPEETAPGVYCGRVVGHGSEPTTIHVEVEVGDG